MLSISIFWFRSTNSVTLTKQNKIQTLHIVFFKFPKRILQHYAWLELAVYFPLLSLSPSQTCTNARLLIIIVQQLILHFCTFLIIFFKLYATQKRMEIFVTLLIYGLSSSSSSSLLLLLSSVGGSCLSACLDKYSQRIEDWRDEINIIDARSSFAVHVFVRVCAHIIWIECLSILFDLKNYISSKNVVNVKLFNDARC